MASRSNRTIFTAKSNPPRLSLVQQSRALARHYPESSSRVSRSELLWRGPLCPTTMSRDYSVELRYKLGKNPKVRVLAPELDTLPGKRLPHIYRDGTLCLFYPRAREWHGGLLLAETIIPWAAEWLFHYEVWLACGAWEGGGIHGGQIENPDADRE